MYRYPYYWGYPLYTLLLERFPSIPLLLEGIPSMGIPMDGGGRARVYMMEIIFALHEIHDNEISIEARVQ